MKKNNHFTSYEFIADNIREKIEENIYQPDQRLPSVVELCAEYSASDSTIRKSLDILKKEGYIYSKRRVGLFVSSMDQKQYIMQFNEFDNLKVSIDNQEICQFIRNNQDNSIPDPRFSGKKSIACFRKFYAGSFPVIYRIDHLLSKANVTPKISSAEKWINEMDLVLDSAAVNKKICLQIEKPSQEIIQEMILSDESIVCKIKREYFTENSVFIGFSLLYIATYDIKLQIREK